MKGSVSYDHNELGWQKEQVPVPGSSSWARHIWSPECGNKKEEWGNRKSEEGWSCLRHMGGARGGTTARGGGANRRQHGNRSQGNREGRSQGERRGFGAGRGWTREERGSGKRKHKGGASPCGLYHLVPSRGHFGYIGKLRDLGHSPKQ